VVHVFDLIKGLEGLIDVCGDLTWLKSSRIIFICLGCK
jgi:pseudouridine-5'-phosphate glycosidase